MPDPAEWSLIVTLYNDALELAETERAAFLVRACDDDEVRREVESLLAARAEAGEFLASTALAHLVSPSSPSLLSSEQPTAPLPVAALRIGQQLRQYQVLAPLGAGGMGEIFLAQDTRLRRKVALKILPAKFMQEAERIVRFEQEAYAVSALNHPNILTIYDIGQVDQTWFMATEFIEGQSLRQHLAHGPALALRQVLQLLEQIAQALAAAHAAGIIHRDIKPDNVMVRSDGYAKVLDFGLAKLTEKPTETAMPEALRSITDSGTIMGTVTYMSPEQARGLKVDARSDIFSLGVLAYEMITGGTPFTGETMSDVLAAILHHEPPPLAPVLPRELQRILARALAKDRAARYQTVQEFAQDLKGLVAELEFEERLAREKPLGQRQAATEQLGPKRLAKESEHKATALICRQCQAENPSAAKFCLQCGSALVAHCANCQTALPTGAKFCMSCGHQVGGATTADKELLSRLAAATPSSLANKLRAVQPTAGERKIVTALFADFSLFAASGRSLDPEDLPAIINQVLDRLTPTIFYYEGGIAQVLGNSLLAFFGAPLTHEDDPVRAVRAALEMCDQARLLANDLRRQQGIEFEIRIGLNTGPIVIGHVTSQLKFEFTVVGDTVNLATRAQAAAPAMSVLATEDTQRLIAAVFDCSELTNLGVKGYAGEVRVAQIHQSRTERDRVHGLAGLHSQMVGRDAELTALLQLSQAVQAGLGRAAVIVGEPGLGKTRLLTEWKKASQETPSHPSSLHWIEGHCLSYGQGLAYHLLQSLLRGLLGVAAATDEAQTRAALFKLTAELLGETTLEVYPYLGHLLSLKLEGEALERVRQLDPQALQNQYFMSLRRLLTALAARQPLGLLLEDIHWADPSSVELLNKLLPLTSEAPVLFCFVTRPERDVPGWRLVNTARDLLGGRLTELTLHELNDADSQQLIANLLDHAALPETTHQLILRKADGNPFFVEEVIRMVIERGTLVQHDGRWIAQGEIAASEIPDNLQSLLLARIDRLPDDAKRALRVASVIGRQFAVNVLAEVLKQPRPGELS